MPTKIFKKAREILGQHPDFRRIQLAFRTLPEQWKENYWGFSRRTSLVVDGVEVKTSATLYINTRGGERQTIRAIAHEAAHIVTSDKNKFQEKWKELEKCLVDKLEKEL